MKGRKPIPAKIINIRGGSALTHRPEKADIEVKSGMPQCPQYLGPIARKEWRRFTRELKQIGHVGKIDQSIIAVYCRNFEIIIQKGEEVAEMDTLIKKMGYVKVDTNGKTEYNKAIDVRAKAEDQRGKAEDRMVKALQELFGSPSARAKHKIEKPKPLSKAQKFMDRKNSMEG